MSDLVLGFFRYTIHPARTPIREEDGGGCGHRKRSLLGGAASGAGSRGV